MGYTVGEIVLVDEGVNMCRAVKCRQCGKTTWAGCGQHVESVMSGVPRANRCPGHTAEPAASGSSFFAKLFGR